MWFYFFLGIVASVAGFSAVMLAQYLWRRSSNEKKK
jgi:hypothetical protein